MFRKRVNGKCQSHIFIICVLLSLFIQSGCHYYFRKNLIPPSASFYGSPPAARQYSASFKIDCTTEMITGQQGNMSYFECDRYKNEFYHVLNNSGHFSAISPNGQKSDFYIDIQLEHVYEGNLLAAGLYGFTLGLFPYSNVDGYDMNITVTMKNGQTISYKISDRGENISGAILDFDEEKKSSTSSIGELRINMFRHLILQMKKDGFLGDFVEIALLQSDFESGVNTNKRNFNEDF